MKKKNASDVARNKFLPKNRCSHLSIFSFFLQVTLLVYSFYLLFLLFYGTDS